MSEQWSPVPGFDGLYSVSTRGRVRSDSRVVKCGNGRPHTVKERFLSSAKKRSGHLTVCLRRPGSPASRAYVHRLVLLAFVGPAPDGYEAAHNDGNPANNCLSNLRWATRSSNHADKVVHGTHNRGEAHPLCKVSDDTVRAIRSCGLPAKKAAEKFGVSMKYASAVLTGASRRFA